MQTDAGVAHTGVRVPGLALMFILKNFTDMRYVTFSGGFHNSGEIRVRVNERQYNALREGFYSYEEILSKYQMKRLDNHFCGIKDCMCGGVYRAKLHL